MLTSRSNPENEILSKNKLAFIIEIELSVNQRLFDQRFITEEMYIKAKEQIIKKAC